MRSSTPEVVTDRIAAFIARVSPGQEAVRIPVAPLPGAKVDSCFLTVMAHIEQHGGDMVVGRQIGEIPDVMLEAIFHGVWHDRSGKLHEGAGNCS